MPQREQMKAAQYIQQLDEARCEGNWDAVPELVRKIKKHAPHRNCTSSMPLEQRLSSPKHPMVSAVY
jgi:hypothetical protein